MSKRSRSTSKSRREFFKDMAMIGGAAAVAAAIRPGAAETPVATKPDVPRPQGYRVTPHILDYYDKARR